MTAIEHDGEGFRVLSAAGEWQARAVLIATGLREEFPSLPSIRSFYGTSIHSCMTCDAYEHADRPIALIGETSDLAQRAMLLSQWSRDLIVFTNAIGTATATDEARLAERGIRVDRRALADVAGDRTGLTGVVLADGETVPRQAAFIRPQWRPNLDDAQGLGLAIDGDGLLQVDQEGRTSADWVYAAGDSVPPGPQQLIVAADAGARTGAAINSDLVAAL